MILRSGIYGPRETDQGREKNPEPNQDRKTGGPWIPIYDKTIFKGTDIGSISSLNTLTTWFDETNHYFGLVREVGDQRLVLL